MRNRGTASLIPGIAIVLLIAMPMEAGMLQAFIFALGLSLEIIGAAMIILAHYSHGRLKELRFQFLSIILILVVYRISFAPV
ncbi:MAG: hypothetical protein HC880_11940 [Bacteroidia bacterium]|nr:hypothetical protein [Bacteroidia bacterium]